MKRSLLPLILLAAAACSTQSRPTAPPPAPPVTPTPGALMRSDPTVVEETDTYVIRRYKKSDYAKVDDRHFKIPILAKPVEFFKEDDEYYYTSTPKEIPEETELKRQSAASAPPKVPAGETTAPRKSGLPVSRDVSAADFTDIAPARVAGRLRLEKVAKTGLPSQGMWRASFVLADANGDGIVDIVAPPARVGDGKLKIWLGDGKGAFALWPLTFTEGGKPQERFSIDYGAVAIGDIDGDGLLDVASASHGAGLVSLFGDGQGGFAIVRTGLPGRDFSAQAVVLLDANGDGKLDVVASRDNASTASGQTVDKTQVRVYLFLGRDRGWEFKKDGLVGGFYSNSLHGWDYDRDGRQDVLTGSHYTGALTLLWKNTGDGTFSGVPFPAIEPYSYHFSTTPGTFGRDKASAFLDGYSMQANVPESQRASGLTLYVYENGNWSKHRIWRKKDFKGYLFTSAMGDLDGDGLDDIVFPDSEAKRLRVLFQQPDGSFVEAAEAEEPALDSPGQTVRLADLNRDGRLDVVLSKTVATGGPNDPGGWEVYLNRK